MSTVVETCTIIGKPIVEEMGYVLVDVEYVREGKNFILRYLVDSEKGIDLDECAIMSEKISLLLDEQDPIKQEFILEIASPGAERPLKTKEDLFKAINKFVHVKLYAPINGLKEYEGDLIQFDGETLTIRYKEKTATKTVEILYSQISKIRLAILF